MAVAEHTLTLEVTLPDQDTPIEGEWSFKVLTERNLVKLSDDTVLAGTWTGETTDGTLVITLPDTEHFTPSAYYQGTFTPHDTSVCRPFSTEPFLLTEDKTLADIMSETDLPITPSMVAEVEEILTEVQAYGAATDATIKDRVQNGALTSAYLNGKYAAPLYGNLIDRPSPAQNLVYFAADVGRAYFAVPNGVGGYTWESADGVDAVKDFGAKGDGTADDAAAIQAAIDAASVAGRPAVVWFPSSGGPGAYRITNTINVALAQAGTVLASPARSGVGQGARFVWGGAANGTMLSLAAERIQVANLGFDGNDSAATLIQAGSKRGLQLINVEGRKWTGNNSTGGTPVAGAGLVLGNGGANLNEFYCSGLRLQGSVAGSVGILISTSGTEIMQFVNTSLGGATADPGLLRWIESNTNIVFHGLIMDDGAMTDYAIKSNAGFVQLLPFASETPKLLWMAAAGRTGLTILRGDARSLAPGVGEYAVVLQGQGHFRLEGVRFQRKAGASVAPNVSIGSSVLGVVEEAVKWESADSGAVGTYVTTPSKVLSLDRTRGVVESLHRSGTWRTPDHTTRTTTDGTTVGRCFYIPLRVRRTLTFDRIACEITTAGAAGSVARLGLYSSQDGLPTTAVYRSLPLDCTVTGEVGETFATPLTVQPGLYFLAVVPQVALPTFRGSATFVEGVSAASFIGSNTKSTIYEAGVTGALPSTAAPTVETGTAPLVALRAV